MSETFFIGDLHLGHKSILRYEPEARPFSTLEEMHEVITERWNNVVKTEDKVIVVGDVCFSDKYLPLIGNLNGKKYLVGGNHDNLSTKDYLEYFYKVTGCIEIDKAIVTHIPVHPGQFNRYALNIHGHLHSRRIMLDGSQTINHGETPELIDRRYANVSCEQYGLAPVSYTQLREEYDFGVTINYDKY